MAALRCGGHAARGDDVAWLDLGATKPRLTGFVFIHQHGGPRRHRLAEPAAWDEPDGQRGLWN